MRTILWPSCKLIVATLLICAVAYPVATLAFAMAVAPESRMGSLVFDGQQRVVGSRLLAQGFTRPEYFWPRPSACDYNASGAAGSNLSPANPQIGERAAEIIARLGESPMPVPADLITTSGGGLDPHISLEAAEFQVARVAKARGLDDNTVAEIVDRLAEPLPLTFPAVQLVNVLELNMELDKLAAAPAPE